MHRQPPGVKHCAQSLLIHQDKPRGVARHDTAQALFGGFAFRLSGSGKRQYFVARTRVLAGITLVHDLQLTCAVSRRLMGVRGPHRYQSVGCSHELKLDSSELTRPPLFTSEVS